MRTRTTRRRRSRRSSTWRTHPPPSSRSTSACKARGPPSASSPRSVRPHPSTPPTCSWKCQGSMSTCSARHTSRSGPSSASPPSSPSAPRSSLPSPSDAPLLCVWLSTNSSVAPSPRSPRFLSSRLCVSSTRRLCVWTLRLWTRCCLLLPRRSATTWGSWQQSSPTSTQTNSKTRLFATCSRTPRHVPKKIRCSSSTCSSMSGVSSVSMPSTVSFRSTLCLAPSCS
mmetsp:Transcript_53469/g.125749  ORF Transcript_53469/g.125749 Transcript_53469/m.125749 type:complete len:226 (-) Transcript_53469:908-1585(-)